MLMGVRFRRADGPLCSLQENFDPRRPAMSGLVLDARGRKVTKRVVDIRELNEQAKVIDDLK